LLHLVLQTILTQFLMLIRNLQQDFFVLLSSLLQKEPVGQ
jgi:hypothetical protein